MGDEELIQGCKSGDRNAQKLLYDKYSKQMYLVCLRYCKEQQVAEDILQDSFIKVFKSIGDFRGESKLPYWIKRIVVNTALNAQRNKLYLFPMVDIDTLHESQSDPLEVADYSMDELLTMIGELPTGCKVIFNLYAIEGYKHHEIAKMLEINEGTSKSQYARAKHLLREKLTKYSRQIKGR